MFSTFALVLLVAGSFSTPAMAGAFGIGMGTPPKKLTVVEVFDDSGPVKSYDIRVPAPSADFGIYTVDLAPRTGVCRIYAVSRNYPNDDNGAQIKAVYGRVKAGLVRKYGQPAEQCERPATGNFAMSLHNEEDSRATDLAASSSFRTSALYQSIRVRTRLVTTSGDCS